MILTASGDQQGSPLAPLRMDKGQVTDREGWSPALPVPHMPGPQSPEVGRIPESDGWGPHLALQAPAPPSSCEEGESESAAFPKFN